MPTLEFENGFRSQGYFNVAGVDEVGRGSWAGPLVAAAVILPVEDPDLKDRLPGVCDSKQIEPERREELFELILVHALSIGLGWASHHVIDNLGLGYANTCALERAVQNLRVRPDAILVDHFRLPNCLLPQRSLTKGDCLSLSIAAASIVAKVFRDRWMIRSDCRHPGYGFALHKGYGTPMHRKALSRYGPCPIHRQSFRPIAAGEA